MVEVFVVSQECRVEVWSRGRQGRRCLMTLLRVSAKMCIVTVTRGHVLGS